MTLPETMGQRWSTAGGGVMAVHSSLPEPGRASCGPGTVHDVPRTVPFDDPSLGSALKLAADQCGVVSRRQLYAAGVTRWQVTGHVRAGRWQKVGDQSVCTHTGPLDQAALHWAAVFQGGPRAQLDGESALVASGLERYTVERIRVTVPRGARIRRTRAFDIRQTRRWAADDAVATGIPRTRPAVAAVRGGLWAKTDRQATLLITMVVQQGLATAGEVGLELLRIRRDKRRGLLHSVVNDLIGGVRSLGELDVAGELRRRGLPEPERQVLRRGPRGRYFLDLYWPQWKLVVEIDGIHHSWAEHVVDDALRQNSLALDGDTVLRLPLLGYRLRPDEFFEQIERGLEAGGYRRDVIRTEA
jgi:very-short-patch-repair endonuclease